MFPILAIATIVIQSFFLIVQNLKIDSRNARIQSLEIKAQYWQDLTTKLRQPSSIGELKDKFSLEADSVTHQLTLTPRVPIEDFYGFAVRWDSIGVTSIVELKP